MRRTKIICTLGPATDQGTVLEDMMKAGMNVARFNFSHGTHEEQKVRIDQVKEARTRLKLKRATFMPAFIMSTSTVP